MNNIIEKLIEKKNAPKLILYSFLTIALAIIIFLTCNLYYYYKDEVVSTKDELVYVFKPNTIKYNNANYYVSDKNLSEQFISYGVSYGVDVSEWQGAIDWQKVATTGIDFAMIRCGFRQTEGSEIMEDGQFRVNMEGAINAGLKVGVYFFGAARNQEEALEEVNFTLNLIKDYELTYPVVYDLETFDTGRLKNVSYSQLTDNILTFTETLSSYGYSTMVYTYKNAFQYKLDTGKLDGKLIWLAHYVDETDYKGNYNMWQYTSEGRVDGINTNVDLNISYFNYVENVDEIIANPNYKKAPEVNFEKVDDKVRTTRTTTIRNSATYDMPNSLGQVQYGTELIRTGKSDKFSRVLYNGRIVYIENSSIVSSN